MIKRVLLFSLFNLFLSFSGFSQKLTTEEQAQVTKDAEEKAQLHEKMFGVMPPQKQQMTQAPNPNAFPKYEDSGNPESDQKRYAEVKKAWIAAHPDEYRKMNETPITYEGKVVVTRADYSKCPGDAQLYMQEHPEIYIIID